MIPTPTKWDRRTLLAVIDVTALLQNHVSKYAGESEEEQMILIQACKTIRRKAVKILSDGKHCGNKSYKMDMTDLRRCYAFAAENEYIVTSPRSEIVSAGIKRNQSICENNRIPSLYFDIRLRIPLDPTITFLRAYRVRSQERERGKHRLYLL